MAIDPSRYRVALLDDRSARDFIEDHHYSGSYPAAVHRCGLFEDGRLAGAAVFSVPVRKATLETPFPDLVPYRESLELGRFVLLDQVPANGETFFLARAFELIRERGIRGVVSFSDPVPRRTAGGEIVFRGHVGTIYQASNAVYAGRSRNGTLHLFPDGSVLNRRTMAKIAGAEIGAAGAIRLIELKTGRPSPAARGEWMPWVGGLIDDGSIRLMKHPGNHRYLFGLDRRVRKVLGPVDAGQYPKRD